MKNINYLLVLLAFLSLESCAPAFLAGGAAVVGGSAIQERTLGTQVNDTTTWGRVKSALAAKDKGYSDITIEVNEGRVLLIGNVQTPEDRLEVLKTVWKQQGVSEVVNEIQVGESEQSLKQVATDSWITTQLKSKLLVEQNVKSMNYNIETIDGIVYLIGIAQNQEELNTVTSIASKIKNVQKVVSYVRLKDSKVRKDKYNL